jgi:hypothetical protein
MARVTLDDIDVMCVVAEGGPAGGAAAFEALEARLPTLRGRRFYGTFHSGEYRACVAMRSDDDPAALGLGVWRIPGGEYEQLRLHDWHDRIPEIPALFDAMVPASEVDPTRPSIELYRSARELVLLRPVRS